jgi:hypothetical protein
MDNTSQATKIFQAIKNSNGIENWKLARIALNYRGRISELRQDGHNIYCERQVDRHGRWTGTWKYYLNEEED